VKRELLQTKRNQAQPEASTGLHSGGSLRGHGGILFLVFVAVLLGSLSIGRYAILPIDVVRIFAGLIGLGEYVRPPSFETHLVFWNIRFPRVLMSVAVGSGISIAGVVFQSLFRNPLAAPDILGVTAGSCFGAALSIICFTQFAPVVQGTAFVFGILAVSIAYILAHRSMDRSASVLVITGIVVSAVFQAGVSIMMYLADPYNQLSSIVFWIMGSFHVASWTKVQTTLPIVVVGSILLTVFGWRLNIMTQNDEDALSLGVNIFRWRLFYVVTGTFMVASSVAAVGTISWIGLIIPHIARFLVGTEHKRLLPTAAILGGLFLLVMDTVARTISASEIPISIITSILGAPFLGYLVISRKGGASIGGH
jgi:iron complex transport system permease protein